MTPDQAFWHASTNTLVQDAFAWHAEIDAAIRATGFVEVRSLGSPHVSIGRAVDELTHDEIRAIAVYLQTGQFPDPTDDT